METDNYACLNCGATHNGKHGGKCCQCGSTNMKRSDDLTDDDIGKLNDVT